MAKESELEKIELTVSVNCCDGCKKKVKKALQSIEGVLKIEVDSLQPKVTVLGNVDPQVLTKRLSKVGKQAEVRRHGNQNGAAKGNQGETMPAVAKEKEKKSKTDKSDCQREQAKPASDSSCGNGSKDEGAEKSSKKKDETELIQMGNPFPFPAYPEVIGYKLPEMMGDVRSNGTQYALTIPLPCYGVPSYALAAAAAPLPQTCCSQEYFHHHPPLFNTPTTRVGDYFSDENTLGCSVM
ncbi:hypothetical protein QUC31_017872 [Theobroma cacao]|nr:Heavy metal-associated domain [Theobroma cacao]WRX22404.1 Heavy metal-associated domain [Theobroma cacao]